MLRRLLNHATGHAVGYVALVFALLALAGASYASLHIPNGAVGEKQLKNQSIDPVKWDPNYVTSFVRRFAGVASNGARLTGSPFTQTAKVGNTPGVYDVTWGDAWNGTCITQATVQNGGNAPGFADTNVTFQPNNATVVTVTTFDATGKPADLPFTLSVICPRGAGSGTRYPYTLP